MSLILKLFKFTTFKQNRILTKTFVEFEFEVLWVSEFQTKANSYEDICWNWVWTYVSLWVSNQAKFFWRHFLRLSLKLCQFMSFKQKRFVIKAFVASPFEVIWVYEFQTTPNLYEEICWVLVWSYLSIRVSNKSEFLCRHLLSLSFKLCKFMSFKQKWILMQAFVDSQFEIMRVYEFQTKANFYEDICWVSVWSYLSWCVSTKT